MLIFKQFCFFVWPHITNVAFFVYPDMNVSYFNKLSVFFRGFL